jgi:uncharacterized membrane protein
MNVLFNTPISITISSAKLLLEDDNTGTIQFKLLDQPCTLVIDKSQYIYDTTISVNDRVQLIHEVGYFGIGSQGIVQAIIPESTVDYVDILFDKIVPDNMFVIDDTVVKISSQVTSVLFRTLLSDVVKI